MPEVPVIQARLRDFLASGELGPLSLERTRAEVEQLLGPPPSTNADRSGWSYGMLHIWLAGRRVERFGLYFTVFEWVARAQVLDIPDLPAALTKPSCTFSLEEFEASELCSGLTYEHSGARPDEELVFPSGVIVVFNHRGLVSLRIEQDDVRRALTRERARFRR